MTYQMAATAVTANDLEGRSQAEAFSNAIRRTFVQHFTRFQLTVRLYIRILVTHYPNYSSKLHYHVLIDLRFQLFRYLPERDYIRYIRVFAIANPSVCRLSSVCDLWCQNMIFKNNP